MTIIHYNTLYEIYQFRSRDWVWRLAISEKFGQKFYGVFQPLVNSQKWVTVERLWNCKSISPGLHWSSQSSSSDPSLQSISPSHTWLYSTHSRPSLQGLVPTRHLKRAVAVVLVAMVEHPTSSEPSRQWERPSQTRASSIHFLLSLQRKSPVWIQLSILGIMTSWRRRKTRVIKKEVKKGEDKNKEHEENKNSSNNEVREKQGQE